MDLKNPPGKVSFVIGPPPLALGDLWFRLRPCVCVSVTARSQNPFIGFFWFFAQSCGLWMWRKWHFRILAKKSRFRRFGPKMVKNWPYWPKNGHLTYFSKSGHRILLVFAIETRFLVLKKMAKNFLSWKNLKIDFLALFWSIIHCLWFQKWVFRPFLTIFLQSVDVLWSSFVIWTIFMDY